MPISQSDFVRQQNIRRYEQELSFTPVGPRRQMLLLLLTEERAKVARPTGPRHRRWALGA